MTDAIDLTKDQLNQLTALLRRFLPGVAVWAYGSRVKWTARPNSDLDLVAFTVPDQRAQVAELKDALAESNLPFPVDLHVWDDVPERFREIIRKEYVVVQEAKEPTQKQGVAVGWEETTLANVSSDVSYGYTASASEEKVGPHFLRITDIQNGIVNWGKVPYCPQKCPNVIRIGTAGSQNRSRCRRPRPAQVIDPTAFVQTWSGSISVGFHRD